MYVAPSHPLVLLPSRGLTRVGHAFFSKRTQRSAFFCILLQKNVAFFAFFYVLCKRMLRSLRSFTFLRKERKRTHRSFGSHKSPKTRKKNVKERCVL